MPPSTTCRSALGCRCRRLGLSGALGRLRGRSLGSLRLAGAHASRIRLGLSRLHGRLRSLPRRFRSIPSGIGGIGLDGGGLRRPGCRGHILLDLSGGFGELTGDGLRLADQTIGRDLRLVRHLCAFGCLGLGGLRLACRSGGLRAFLTGHRFRSLRRIGRSRGGLYLVVERSDPVEHALRGTRDELPRGHGLRGLIQGLGIHVRQP